MKGIEENFRMVAKTISGLEEICAHELRKLGAQNIQQHNRAVSFDGNLGVLYKANLYTRTALRILVPIHEFEVTNEYDFYNGIKKIDWSQFMFVDDTLAIDTVLNTSLFNHSQYISQKAKDAIVDQFREKFSKRPSVNLHQPSLRLHIHIFYQRVIVALDSSGDSLHKRGYREKTNLAPINETLAAGLVLLSGYDGRVPFVDPMCGSGTILIEAAMIAANIPAGIHRAWFGFQEWKIFLPYDEALWTTIYNSAIEKISHEEVKLYGGDLSPHVARKAKENVKRAKVEDMVHIRCCNMTNFDVPPAPGIVIANPPYGERMDKDNVAILYKTIGDTFKHRFAGYDCWLISNNLDALKQVGLRPSRKITVFNGQLACRFMKYSMYTGTKKVHKLL